MKNFIYLISLILFVSFAGCEKELTPEANETHNEWVKLTAQAPMSHFKSFTIDNIPYIFGGYRSGTYLPDSNTYKYDTKDNTFTLVGKLPILVYNTIQFSIGGMGYLGLGTLKDGRTPNNKMFRFNPENNSWTILKDAPFAGWQGASSFIIGERVFVGFGGVMFSNEFGEWLNSSGNELWEYLPKSDTWVKQTGLGKYAAESGSSNNTLLYSPIRGFTDGENIFVTVSERIKTGTAYNRGEYCIYKYTIENAEWERVTYITKYNETTRKYENITPIINIEESGFNIKELSYNPEIFTFGNRSLFSYTSILTPSSNGKIMVLFNPEDQSLSLRNKVPYFLNNGSFSTDKAIYVLGNMPGVDIALYSFIP